MNRWALSHAVIVPRFDRRPHSTDFARALRKELSEAEVRLWSHLRYRFTAKWRRQEPIGPFYADFLCYSERLIVEVDGEQHADSIAYDRRRDAYVRKRGFQVLRVPAHEVMADIEGVLDTIDAAMRPA